MYFFFLKFIKIRRECIKNYIYFIFLFDYFLYYIILVEDVNVEMILMSELVLFW